MIHVTMRVRPHPRGAVSTISCSSQELLNEIVDVMDLVPGVHTSIGDNQLSIYSEGDFYDERDKILAHARMMSSTSSSIIENDDGSFEVELGISPDLLPYSPR